MPSAHRRRRKLRPNGAERTGFLTETALALRWGRAHNTLSSWRTRPHPDLKPLAWEIHDGAVYYAIEWIRAYEADQLHSALRPAPLRGTPFPDFPPHLVDAGAVRSRTPQAELPLQMLEDYDAADATAARIDAALSLVDHERSTALPPRGFKSITIAAGYALAIATDDTAYFASVLGGLEFLTWTPIAALPQQDHVAQLFARRAA